MPVREMYEDHTLRSLFNAINGFKIREKQNYETRWERTQAVINHTLSRRGIELPWQKKKPKKIPEQVTPGDPKKILKQHLKPK